MSKIFQDALAETLAFAGSVSMVTTYVTFGQTHIHRVNGKIFDRDSVAVIHRKTAEEGRDFAFEVFGPKFFTTYTDLDNVKLEYYPRGLIELERE
jgi:hypothetical protein